MRATVLASALVATVGTAMLWQATEGGRALTTEVARRLSVAEAPRPVPDADLETMTGAHQHLYPDPGGVTLVEFIYTTCPTLCQSAGADFARLRDRALAAGLGPRLRLISLSFDPETDDPAQMAAYGAAHGADGTVWTVARPDPAALPGLLAAFGVTVIDDDWGGYTHNAAIHLVDDRGRLAAITDTEDVAGAMAAVWRVLQ
jgi:protein SCO1/2